VSLIEYLEGGDYFNFVKKVPEEMEKYYNNVKIIKNGPWNSWYICKI